MNFGDKSYWQALVDVAQREEKPSPGKRVRVTKGKHKGKEGEVKRHMTSRYSSALRYAQGASLDLRILRGREGFTVLVQPVEGEAFWVPAENVEVLP